MTTSSYVKLRSESDAGEWREIMGEMTPDQRLRVYRELREVSRTKIKKTATTPRVLRNEPLESLSVRLAMRRRTNQVTTWSALITTEMGGS
jgi:hypothetical protein